MSDKNCLLLCEGGSAEDIDDVSNALATYLELPSKFVPMAYGDPVSVKILHASGSEPSADAITSVLTAAKCDVTVEAKASMLQTDADASAAAAVITSSDTQLLVLIGGAALLSNLESTVLGAEALAPHPNPNSTTDVIESTRFKPSSGVLLVEASEKKWALQHIVVPQKEWWRLGSSQYEESGQ